MGNAFARLDHALSRSGRHSPPGAPGHLLAKAVSPWGASMQGLAAAIALRAAGRPWVPVALTAPAAVGVAKLLKRLTSRSRPGISRFERKGHQSFPSSHVAGPTAVLASLFVLAPRSKGWMAVLTIGTGLVAAAGLERVCAAQHWPSDVLVGAALGGAIGVAMGRAAASRALAAPRAAQPQ
ncbi:MAG TPA: phosphatase PAP2 family protein [Myxococcales bacterium]|nr:phosphatase PAP2 family protein [Myxococcales bacterium]